MQFDRLNILNPSISSVFHNKTVVVLGIGGVGGYAVEALARSGIGKIILVDADIVDVTNLNRQIISLHSNIGAKKVEVAKKRVMDIYPLCDVVCISEFITPDNIELLFSEYPDYIIDACDFIPTKKELIRKCTLKNIPFISCMGTGNKLQPEKLQIMDIRKTSYDPIAKIIRKMVNEEHISSKVMVVCSTESPIATNTSTIGSIAFVPGCAGLLCASYVLRKILEENSYDGN